MRVVSPSSLVHNRWSARWQERIFAAAGVVCLEAQWVDLMTAGSGGWLDTLIHGDRVESVGKSDDL